MMNAPLRLNEIQTLQGEIDNHQAPRQVLLILSHDEKFVFRQLCVEGCLNPRDKEQALAAMSVPKILRSVRQKIFQNIPLPDTFPQRNVFFHGANEKDQTEYFDAITVLCESSDNDGAVKEWIIAKLAEIRQVTRRDIRLTFGLKLYLGGDPAVEIIQVDDVMKAAFEL
jgi:hypothetical protein